MTTTARSQSRDQLRDAMQAARDRGVTENLDDIARICAAKAILRCCDAADQRGASPGWLASAMLDGGAWSSVQHARSGAPTVADDGLTDRDRRRIAAFDELMAEQGLRFGEAA